MGNTWTETQLAVRTDPPFSFFRILTGSSLHKEFNTIFDYRLLDAIS